MTTSRRLAERMYFILIMTLLSYQNLSISNIIIEECIGDSYGFEYTIYSILSFLCDQWSANNIIQKQPYEISRNLADSEPKP